MFLNALNLAGTLSSVLSYPLLAVAVFFVMAIHKMISKLPSGGYQITLAGWQGKTALWMLAIAGLLYAVDVTDRLGGIAYLQSKTSPIEVRDQVFANERVPLDGYSYRHCTFTNVTFVINGAPTPLDFEHNTIRGFGITTENPAVEKALFVLIKSGVLKIPYVTRDGTRVEPGSGTIGAPPT